MRIFIAIILLSISGISLAQNTNEFIGRSFWQTSPNVQAVKEKIEEGNDPVKLNEYGFDATVYAILENAPFETIKYLVSLEGNEVNKATHDGRNYLMWAAYKGNVELMKYLLEKGSVTDIIDDHGHNLITFAAAGGQQNPEVYDLILENGVKVTDTNRDGANALLVLTPSITDMSIIDYFQKKGLDIQSKDNDGNGMFNYAAIKGNIELMKKLIDMGVDYKGENKEGGNAMIFASYGSRGSSNPLEVFEYLDGLGIQANVTTTHGETPLHNLAYSNKDPKVFEFIVEKGVDINQANEEGNTLLLNAINGENEEIAQIYIPKVADINHQNEDGYSALTYAVIRHQDALIPVLLEAGANADVVDSEGNNLVFYAFDSFDEKEKASFESTMKMLKKEGVSMDPVQDNGNSLLQVATEKGEVFLIEQALNMGADINAKNREGLTVLHLAAMKAENEKVLEYLLENGADKSILTDFDESAFDLANENEILAKSGVNLDFLK